MPKKLSKEEFIEKAIKVHGDRYDYSNVKYKNSYTKIKIICPIHGEFEQLPTVHLKGFNCPKCKFDKLSKLNSLTTEEFIDRARKVHGDKYDYSKVNYINNSTKITIICPIHGEFEQLPSNHLSKNGCPRCVDKSKKSTENFIKKANKIHGNYYDYSKVEYINNFSKVCIICPIHGEFWQTPNNHLNNRGCPLCGVRKSKTLRSKYTTESFIKKLKEIYGDKLIYDKTIYRGVDNQVIITCPIHGDFSIKASTILKGNGCLKCRFDNNKNIIHNMQEFLEQAKSVHGDRYDYSNAVFKNSSTKIEIKCNKCREIFYQTPIKHIRERKGCPRCRMSHLEVEVEQFLINNKIEHIKQYNIDNQYLDFYLPKYNIAIECQGKQHFGYGGWTKDEEKRKKGFELIFERDIKKYNKCKDLGIKLYYFTNFLGKIDDQLHIYNKNNVFYSIKKIFEKSN
ncbi:MAG: hypothetical protein IKT40_12205 [Bacilli bacterium]|nr:hypothetical protein [Bacilli bacterium]